MTEFPSGTVAFLFTDIEGSTKRWELDSAAMWVAVERHFALLDDAIAAQNGVLFKTIGDAVQAAFPSVPAAVAAAVAAQAALRAEDWGELRAIRVRMAIHVGEATPRDGDYLAPCLNRLARLLGTGYGEQILLSEAARAMAASAPPPGHDLLDLGAHRLRDLLQPERIYQLRGPGLVADFPPLKSLDRHLHNLPAQPTALLGRETEVAATRALLEQEGARIVTLTGPGGTGKTRLGLQVGAELVETFGDGVWFVPLAAIADPNLVVPAIAQPLGVREIPGEPLLTTLQEYLLKKHALLLLDNFEHVTAAAPDVSALLAACPQVQALVTSREPLRITGERELPVSPLSLPDQRQSRGLAPTAFMEYPAIRLFVERAQAVKPDFELSETNAADVAAVCRRLDGLPLAIELAAARVRVLPPGQLLTRLDKRLKILTGGNRDLPARQQTLRAAIEWSHDLLDPDEQALFARLAVFSGGCTFEAAEAVSGGSGELALDVLDGLDSLTQKSLLRPEDGSDGETRFTMLETIREYGLERLDATGDPDTVRRAHADYFVNLAETAELRLTSSDQVAWLNRLSAEHDNFRSTLAWLEQGDGHETRLRIVAALWRFWWMRGHLTEGRGWLERALTEAQGQPPAVLAQAFSGAGILAESQGDYEQAITLHETALGLWRQVGDRLGIAASLTNLGIIQRIYGDNERSSELHEQALSLWREIDDEGGISSSLHELGWLALNRGDYDEADNLLTQSLELSRRSGEPSALGTVLETLGILAFYMEDYDRAAKLYQESMDLWRELDDSRMIAYALANIGEAKHHQGDLEGAETLYQESLALFRELGERRGTAFALFQLGRLALMRNDGTGSAARFMESLALRQQVGEKPAVIETLEGLAGTACVRDQPSLSVRLFAAAEALRLTIDAPLAASYSEERERYLALARQSLGDTRFAREWAQGEVLSLDQAIAEAMAGVGATAGTSLLTA
jgi:predicted ATPase/class 3 adenylate cyclase/tetratricopeptide (TPR) repeat protein